MQPQQPQTHQGSGAAAALSVLLTLVVAVGLVSAAWNIGIVGMVTALGWHADKISFLTSFGIVLVGLTLALYRLFVVGVVAGISRARQSPPVLVMTEPVGEAHERDSDD